jgi:hypothetical protein
MSPANLRTASLALALSVPLAAAAAAGAHAEEPPAAGGGALRIRAEPARLELGTEGSAELRVAAPADVRELSFSASAGRVEAVRRLPEGGFTARFRAPAERVPQVAIVAAVARTPSRFEDGWIAIPLSGTGDARVPGAPGEEITLRVGERTFGPRKAGPDGMAIVPIVVPPGVREAHQGFRPIHLRVPDKPLLHAVQDRTVVRADREEEVRAVAYVVAPHGAARRGDVPVFEPSRGTVAVREREAGAFEVAWMLPPAPPGEARLTIRLPGAPSSRAVLAVSVAAGAPTLVAGTGAPTEATSARAAPALLVSGRGGVLADARGRFTAAAGGLAVERPQGADLHGLELAWRVEAEAAGAVGPSSAGSLAAFLCGGAVRRRFEAGLELGAAASVGVALGPAHASPAGRLALSAGLPRTWGVPFVEASALGATAGAPGALVALGLSAGIRFGLESSHGHDPDRR